MTAMSQPQPPPATIQKVGRQDSLSADEAEYELEWIVDHRLSDPKTHPADLGKKPVMLYEVKWKGYDGHTWEPEASFKGSSILRAYQKRHGVFHQ